MSGALIAVGIFFSIIIGIIFGLFLILLQKRRQAKNAIGKIKEQKMKYKIGGKEHDLVGKIDKELKKASLPAPVKKLDKEKPIKKLKKKEPKIKKKIKKRKYLSTLKAYQKKKGKKK